MLKLKNSNLSSINFYFIIIIIIVKKGEQCKAGRERLTPYQSEDRNPTIPTYRTKEEKGKTEGDKKEAALALPLSLAHLLKPASPTPSRRRGHQDRSTEILTWQ